MGRKHVIKLALFEGVSMASTATSAEISVAELDKASVHCYWTGTPAGTFTIEVLNYENGPKKDQWYALDTGTPWTVDASDSQVQIVLNELPFVKLRVKYTPTSGSGSLISYLSSKTVGA